MAESEVRRSGRQRIVSTRLKDMEVSYSSPKGHYKSQDTNSLEKRKGDYESWRVVKSKKTNIKKDTEVKKEERKEPPVQVKVVHNKNADVSVSSITASLVPPQVSEDRSEEPENLDFQITGSSGSRLPSKTKEKANVNLDCPENEKIKDNFSTVHESCVVVKDESVLENNISDNVVSQEESPHKLEKDITAGDETAMNQEVPSKVSLEAVSSKITKLDNMLLDEKFVSHSENTKSDHGAIMVLPDKTVLPSQPLEDGSTDEPVGTSVSGLCAKKEIHNQPLDEPSSETELSINSSEKADCTDVNIGSAVNVLSSYDLTDLNEATVTHNENGELVLSFDSPSVAALVPRVTQHGWECPLDGCHYFTSRKGNWYKHQRVHTGTKVHPCEKCDYVAKTRSNLKRHQMIHSNVKQHICHICQDTFRQKIHLKRHMRYKHESKKVQCAYCDYRCANVNPDLRIHMRRRHLLHLNEEAARALCSCRECGFVAPSKKDLAQHMKFHKPGPELKLFCEYCSFVTDCSSRLTRHLLIHTKEKPYQCGLCDYRASQKQHVVRHMRTKHFVEAELTSSCSRGYTEKQLLAEASKLHEIINGAMTDSETNVQSYELGQTPSANNQDMEVAGTLPHDNSGSVIHPTADIIREGFRVLIDEDEEQSNDSESSLEAEISTQNDKTSRNEQTEMEVLTKSSDISECDQEKSTPVSNGSQDISEPAKKKNSMHMVSLFQPTDFGKDKVFACSYCTLKFSKLLNLHKHLALQHRVKEAIQSLSCCMCDYRTDRKANLLIHMRKHNMPRKHQRMMPNSSLSLKPSKGLLPNYSTPTKQGKSLLKTKRLYSCVLCKNTNANLQHMFKHIEQKHGDVLHSAGGQEPGAFCVVQDVPSLPSTSSGSSKDSDNGYQRVMVEMWPGSPAQPVEIEPPWHPQVSNSSSELIQGLQALADQASNSNALSAAELQAVCSSDNEKYSNIQVPAEQLMNVSSGDYIEIDGEMYKVEFSG